MEKPKIYVHGSYIGTTGYNHHTRDFLRVLSKHAKIKVRNFTVGSTWSGYTLTPHDNEPYINDVDKSMLYKQILWNNDNTKSDYTIYPDESKNFKQDLNIVLCETNHHIFYDSYVGPKIAYNVWESTLQPEGYFNKLKEFDELWVPSKWQRDCTIAQGYDPNKIKVVPEGVDVHTFYPETTNHELTSDGRFKFFLAGRWDYRKSIKEIIETFIKTFDKTEPVDLIISVDNPFSGDGMKTTEERLEYYGLVDERIKILHFPAREDYIKLLKSCHTFVSCARSEGWNLPLIEAMACGTPSIYSECSGQMEFAEGKGLPVKILHEKPVDASTYSHFNESVGNYYEPDFEYLSKQMRNVVTHYQYYKEKSLEESKIIRNKFNWERVAEIGIQTIQNFLANYTEPIDTNKTLISYIDGPKVEIIGDVNKSYFVEFIDGEGNVRFSDTIKNNMWTACGIKYYVPWVIKINGKVVDKFNLENKRVLISLESKSVGDTIAWAPYAVELMKEKNCKVILSTFHNEWFKGLNSYKGIEFINPGQSTNCYVVYRIGWFRDNNGGWRKFDSYPNQVNLIPLQQTATDILGIKFKEINHGVNFKIGKRPIKEKYIVFGPEATSGCKEWSYNHWVILSDMIKKSGYEVIIITQKPFNINGVRNISGKSLNEISTYLYYAEKFVGLGSGLSWINWSLGKHTYMINGFVQEGHEFTNNLTKITNDVCIKCWNDPVLVFDSGDWDWCPVYKGTERQHVCQKSITPLQVFNKLKI